MSKPAFREAGWDEATEYSEDKSVLLGPDGWSCYLGESEDRTWGRDGRGAVAMLNKQHAEITRLTAELTEMSARAREADAACAILGATNGETLIRAAQRVTVEARMVVAELAAARAVPPDVEAAIVAMRAAATWGDPSNPVLLDAAERNLRIAIATTSQPATVGGLLSTAPAGSIVEWLDDDGDWWQATPRDESKDVMARWRSGSVGWKPWGEFEWAAMYLHHPARLVPADQADADPATRGPIGEG